MSKWMTRLKYNPSEIIANSSDLVLRLSYEKDILGHSSIRLDDVWRSREAQAILKKQQPAGLWLYRAKKATAWSEMDYDQYETVKQLAELVEKYRFDKSHPIIQKTVDYLFKHQTSKGDIRGIYANQYSPNYTAMILELLIKAGYGDNKRIIKSLDWLIDDRQQDGGWALAFRTKGYDLNVFDLKDTIEADYSKSSSAMVTGVVLRAMSAHPDYIHREEVTQAGNLLADSFFTADAYPDRKNKEYWTRFGYPFIYTDLVSALDSLSKIGGYQEHPKIVEAIEWLVDRQDKDGLFSVKTTRGNKASQREWMTLAIYRVLKRMHLE